jgi:biotin carboxylase
MNAIEATHVLVGASVGVLRQLERVLPVGSVLVVEDPEISAARDVAALLPQFACVAGFVEAPVQGAEEAARLHERLDRPASVRAVLPGVEYTVVAAARLAEAWGLPNGGASAVEVFRDKALLRQKVRGSGIAQPYWQRVSGPRELAEFRAECGGACVVKPVHLQGSNGVQLLGPDDDIGEAWHRTRAADEAALRTARDGAGGYLAEEWLHGTEFSIEALVHRGRIVFVNATETQVYPGRHPVECGHVVPAELDADAEMPLDAITRLVEATGFDSGVLHAEWILRDGRPYLLECAARLPGGYIPLLIGLAREYDLFQGYLDVLEGRQPAAARPVTQTGGAAVRFLEPRPGRVAGILGLDEARAVPGVIDVWLSVEPGGTVEAVTGSWSRAGEVVAVGANRTEAAAAARAAAKTVQILTEGR